jgi:hypothetical protein
MPGNTPEFDAAFIGSLRFTGGALAPTGITRRGNIAAPTRVGGGTYRSVLSRPIDIKSVKITVNLEGANACMRIKVRMITPLLYEFEAVNFAGGVTDGFTCSITMNRLFAQRQDS